MHRHTRPRPSTPASEGDDLTDQPTRETGHPGIDLTDAIEPSSDEFTGQVRSNPIGSTDWDTFACAARTGSDEEVLACGDALIAKLARYEQMIHRQPHYAGLGRHPLPRPAGRDPVCP